MVFTGCIYCFLYNLVLVLPLNSCINLGNFLLWVLNLWKERVDIDVFKTYIWKFWSSWLSSRWASQEYLISLSGPRALSLCFWVSLLGLSNSQIFFWHKLQYFQVLFFFFVCWKEAGLSLWLWVLLLWEDKQGKTEVVVQKVKKSS